MVGPGRWSNALAALTFALILMIGACAPALNPSGPVVSPTGIVYEPGTPPSDTRFSQTATLYLRQGNVERALELALEGLQSDPTNPIHFYLAGRAYAELGELGEADAMFVEAERIYPAYQLDIEPERERAWAVAFNNGIAAFDADEVDVAIAAWNGAARIFDVRPEAHRNLAVLLADQGRYDDAIDIYEGALVGLEKRPATRALPEDEIAEREALGVTIEENLGQLYLFTGRFDEAEPLLRERLRREPDNLDLQGDLARALTGLGRDAEAIILYTGLLSSGSLEAPELFNVGVALFRSGDYEGAGSAFKQLTERHPNSRDAWFNYVNSLFAAEEWQLLVEAGARLVELDPLSENAGLIAARAHLELGDEEAAREGLEHTEGAPVFVADLRLRPAASATRVEGRLVGNEAEAGSSVRLRFTFYADQGGLLGSETLTLTAPPTGEAAALEVSFDQRADAYRYELVP